MEMLILLTYLPGSGGGGGNERQGGGGGGAIKIVSTGTLTIGANIWADGGRGGARWNEAVEVVVQVPVELFI